MILFIFFIFVNVAAAFTNIAECGCFGAAIKVTPVQLLIFDSCILAGLLAGVTPNEKPSSRPGYVRLRLMLVTAAPIAGFVVALSCGFFEVELKRAGQPLPRLALITLDPTSWFGAPFPLAGQLQGNSRLTRETVKVVLIQDNNQDWLECYEIERTNGFLSSYLLRLRVLVFPMDGSNIISLNGTGGVSTARTN